MPGETDNSENNETALGASPSYPKMCNIMASQATYSQLPAQNGKATSGDQVWQVQLHLLITVSDVSSTLTQVDVFMYLIFKDPAH